jgi:viologen exporter family transport system permease protein
MGGYGVRPDLASAARRFGHHVTSRTRTFAALGSAGFRRYSTYRQATIAAAFTNSIFGFLRCFVLLATIAGNSTGLAAGYDASQLVTYAWVSQALLGAVALWGWTDLADRIRTGDVVADLLRPVHPVVSYLAVDLGRAAHSMMVRFLAPILVGAIFFDLYVPQRPATYLLFVVSVVAAVVVSFGCRYLVNSVGHWLLDLRGVNLLWLFAATAMSGLLFPLRFLPSWVADAMWVLTPFPSILMTPLDVLLERGTPADQVGLIGLQLGWAAVLLGGCVAVQHRAERKLVIQGG